MNMEYDDIKIAAAALSLCVELTKERFPNKEVVEDLTDRALFDLASFGALAAEVLRERCPWLKAA